MKDAPLATLAPLEPDRGQLARFIRALFKHASPETNVSLRAFGGDGGAAILIRTFDVDTDNFKSLINGALSAAREAARLGGVFSPPIAGFKTHKKANEANLSEAYTVSVECDEHPRAALDTLEALIGLPTLIVESGGRWTDPLTGEAEPKLHLHWRLKTPARDAESFAKLKQARAYACAIVGADPSCVPLVHPMRFAGSLHLKDPANPRLCQIVRENEEEIDLDAVYDILRDAAPAEAVEKARTVRTARETATPRNAYQEFAAETVWVSSSKTGWPLANLVTLTEAMQFVPNSFPRGARWKEWNNVGLRLYAATGGSKAGFALFDEFSKKDKEAYNAAFTRKCWEGFAFCPPDHTGASLLFAAAIENGWERQCPDGDDSAPTNTITLPEARDNLQREVDRLVNYHKRTKNWAELFYEEVSGRPAVLTIGLPVEVGVGKTRAAIKTITESDRRFLYTVPMIKPGSVVDEIKQAFVDGGVDVEIFRGRGADDPDHPDFVLSDDPDHENPKMCRDPESVADAMEAMQSVQTTVCKSGKHECQFYSRCSYQKQFEKTPRVWIAAADTLFYRHRIFSKIDMLVLDEGFFEKAIRGNEPKTRIVLPLKVLTESKIVSRNLLGRRFMEQADDDWVRLSTIEGGNPDDPMLDFGFLSRLKIDEWSSYKELSKKLGLLPGRGLSRTEKKAKSKLIRDIVETRKIITIVTELENMLSSEIETSGRLKLEATDDQRRITWRGLASVSKQFYDKPVLYLDATMPSKEILQTLFPEMEIQTSPPVAVPEASYTIQVCKAPTSAEKLIHGDHVKGHLEEIKLCILHYWMQHDRQSTLVVAQLPVHRWLSTQKLPDNIALAHYGAVAGVDRHKDVRLQILVGRTQPGPDAPEAQAGAVSGERPDAIVADGQYAWYPREPVGIQLRNGHQRMVMVDRHPDPLCEAHRYQMAECGQIQALGRARPLGRNADSPLTNVLLFDNVLPTVVDKVIKWKAPSRFIATAGSDGMMLLSPVDMRRIWPTIWESLRTAERDVKDDVPVLPGFVEMTYRPKTPKAKKRIGYFDTARHPDIAKALEERLGVPVEVTP